ncbi:M23 family metallopeptidase [Cryobacterium sp. TMT2-10]|uniref:murein hydrolase activator EnvC family protein n=1 Tax=unclassified Cryobacterium TaxID=2649013 RepID=UPI0010692A7F|nr:MULTISPECIES: M23 family metallopeptidase [unclassified Cryobacterium]TFD16534.1 M23 family metallopeptidase [Cryobacterium sp. TMT2-23]TFD20503.1 M23 family metallopeptidase [Cryobacterium sp. TMT4-10]TFD35215.1 M23 family metallopeptidase [Cryobacterium sp. TMT2-10]
MNLSRLLSAALLVPLAGVLLPAPPGTPSTATSVAGTWSWPLVPPHPVVEGFRAPASEYADGHRGLDLQAIPGTAVFAPYDGVVSFAGVVVDRPVLSLAHAGDVVSTVEPVAAIVGAGERVAAGQLLGHVAAGGHCADRCLHLGLRQHGRYVSPLLYLGGVPRAVLLPAR